jgi:hypothetical protein
MIAVHLVVESFDECNQRMAVHNLGYKTVAADHIQLHMAVEKCAALDFGSSMAVDHNLEAVAGHRQLVHYNPLAVD